MSVTTVVAGESGASDMVQRSRMVPHKSHGSCMQEPRLVVPRTVEPVGACLAPIIEDLSVTPEDLSALAGLVAGALSMACGEYISVASQRDAEDADIAKERAEQEKGPVARLLVWETITETNGKQLVVFGDQNRALGPVARLLVRETITETNWKQLVCLPESGRADVGQSV
jgi:VIT family